MAATALFSGALSGWCSEAGGWGQRDAAPCQIVNDPIREKRLLLVEVAWGSARSLARTAVT
jgi:hypothetical protein